MRKLSSFTPFRGASRTFARFYKGLAASFTVAGICGGLAVLFFMILAAILGARFVKPTAAA